LFKDGAKLYKTNINTHKLIKLYRISNKLSKKNQINIQALHAFLNCQAVFKWLFFPLYIHPPGREMPVFKLQSPMPGINFFSIFYQVYEVNPGQLTWLDTRKQHFNGAIQEKNI